MLNNNKRFIYMILVGIVICLLMDTIVPFPPNEHNKLFDFLMSIVITVFVWEGNLRIDTLMNEKYPWVERPGKRLLIHMALSLVYSVLAIYLPMVAFNRFICDIPSENRSAIIYISIIVGLLITLIILAIEISTQFFHNWKSSLVEVEKYKTESALAQLQNFKNQIDPHFLFNNMSILSSLVYKDTDKAVDFINQLSKVYRYILDNRGNELVTLESELAFVKSYTYLLEIRFDKSIIFKFDIADELLKRNILPMALQMLIENAIKHNEVSVDFPLTISITANSNELTVTNNLQLRSNGEPNSQTGLQNIRDRYKYYTNREVEIFQHIDLFIVKIPILNSI